MNFYDKLDELSRALKATQEYKEYIRLKDEIKNDEKAIIMFKEFKDKQKEHQLKYINGEEISQVEQNEMQNLYSILIQNDIIRKMLENEMKINVYLADMQKVMGETIKDIVEF